MMVMLGCSSRTEAVEFVQVEGGIVNSIGMRLVPVKAGKFLMYGKVWLDAQLYMPKPFQVMIDKDYFLGQFDVTQEEYEKVIGQNPSAFKGNRHPVEMVSWNEAVEFCRKLSELPAEKAAGRVYSLPSEREWQYAARAGSDGLFYHDGDETKLAEYAVCRDNYTDALPSGTAEVGSKKPNAWGFYDMEGNVWQWVADAQSEDKAYVENTSPKNVVWTDGSMRVFLGGGWANDFRMCNCTARYWGYPTKRCNDVGFRVKCMVAK